MISSVALMFGLNRKAKHSNAEGQNEAITNDLESLCQKLCIAFDPGGHALEDAEANGPASDRLIRILRTLLRVSRHRRQKIEQTIQRESSEAEKLRAELASIASTVEALQSKLDEIQVASAKQAPKIQEPPKSNDVDPTESLNAFVAEWSDQIEDGSDAISDVPVESTDLLETHDDRQTEDPDEEPVDFNELLAEAMQSGPDEDGNSLGGVEAFESRLSELDATLTNPEPVEATDDDSAVSESEIDETETVNEPEVAPLGVADENVFESASFPPEDGPIAEIANFAEARQNADRLAELIETSEVRYASLEALNRRLEEQIGRRESLIARIDHELRERQIVLVTDILRAEAEHLSLTEALDKLGTSIDSLRTDLEQGFTSAANAAEESTTA